MSHRIFSVRHVIVAVIAGLLVSAGLWAQEANNRKVSGSYSVIQQTALGSRVQLKLRLELVNHGDDALRVQVLGLESPVSGAHGRPASSAVINLAPQGSETVTQDFLVSRSQYDRWQADFRRHLTLRVESSAEETHSVVISLRRIPGGKEE